MSTREGPGGPWDLDSSAAVPAPAGRVRALDVHKARTEPRVVRRRPSGLTIEQGRDLFAITDRWNAERVAVGLQPLSTDDVLSRILETTRGLVVGKET